MPESTYADAPGAPPHDAPLRAAIAGALATAGAPRTRHRDGDRPHFANRLIFETSPYLRQHAHNPVDWYPWGDTAFDAARRGGKPVFLSVGYATCHWCHVMEEESFEDLGVARLLNERYVAIKVDREERPDVDAIYMTAVQALTGRGGWPMSVWLDAERRPFFAGTYFPAHDGDRGAARGFDSILAELANLYARDPARVAEAGESISDAIRSAMAGGAPGTHVPGTAVLDAAFASYARAYDDEHGGIRGAPKFPSSLPVRFLLRQYRRTGDARALAMAERSLEAMAAGGMHDQLGGGFHRYSTDDGWLVPHFEKMLYDNALLALAYAEGFAVTRRPDFERVVRTTLDYVLREMTAPGGGFYSATDADSQGEEGTFFVWRAHEIRRELGARAEAFERFYGVTERGNFEGANVLYVPEPGEAPWRALAAERETLYAARARRPAPLLDDKILAAWNGLTISALAVAARVLDEPRYAVAAARAADYLLGDGSRVGRLQRSTKHGAASGPGFLEDDAFVVAGLLDLYEATFEPRRLAAALDLARGIERRFADAEGGGWFRSADDHETLVAREKPSYDGAEPTGASVALRSVLRLHAMTGDDAWRVVAERALRAYAPVLERGPAALGEMLLALEFVAADAPEIVLVWPADASPAPFLAALREAFVPNAVLLGTAEGAAADGLARLAPPFAGKTAIDGRPAAYVCRGGACRLPVTDPAEMLAQLDALDAEARRAETPRR